MLKKIWIIAIFIAGSFTLCNCNAEIPSTGQTQIDDDDDDDDDDDKDDDDDDDKKPDLGEFVVTESVPFYGNTYVTQNENNAPDITVNGISNWTHPGSVMSLYFRAGDAGVLNVALYGKATVAGAKLNVTVAGETFGVTVGNTANDTIPVGQVTLPKAGYVRVDLKAQSFFGNTVGTFEKILVGGPATANGIVSIPPTGSENWAYWGRRGPSVHMKYTKPQENIRYFYNEVTVPEGNDVLNSYFMANGFSGGYMGMQVNSAVPAERRILFSVWSKYTTDNPAEIPENYRVVMLRKGAGVTVGEFGNEGSGGQSYMKYPWQAGKTYRFLTEVRPDGAKKTVFTGYFCGDDGQWKLIASFMRPDPEGKNEVHYTGMHSFLENFGVTTGWIEREVRFGNQWACTTEGQWIELTEGTFTYDNTAASGIRFDYDGGLKEGDFYLRNCGFFDDNQTYGSRFTRPAKGGAPVIDFEALENIPTVN